MTWHPDHHRPASPGKPSASIRDPDSFLAALTHLVASIEPAVVFSSLAKLCVPAFSDECTIDVVQLEQPDYRISYPHVTPCASRAAQPHPGQQLVTVFDVVVEDGSSARYSGVVTFAWWRAVPGAADLVIAQLLTDRAIAVIDQERRIAAAERACTDLANLQAGLASNRQVATALGILMASHKITEPDAFAMLRLASQRAHRKMREIADEVVLTGALEEPAARPPRRQLLD